MAGFGGDVSRASLIGGPLRASALAGAAKASWGSGPSMRGTGFGLAEDPSSISSEISVMERPGRTSFSIQAVAGLPWSRSDGHSVGWDFGSMVWSSLCPPSTSISGVCPSWPRESNPWRFAQAHLPKPERRIQTPKPTMHPHPKKRQAPIPTRVWRSCPKAWLGLSEASTPLSLPASEVATMSAAAFWMASVVVSTTFEAASLSCWSLKSSCKHGSLV